MLLMGYSKQQICLYTHIGKGAKKKNSTDDAVPLPEREDEN
jgi:hypothetical protein